MQTWIIPAAAGSFTAYYSLIGQKDKHFRKFPKINKKWGLVSAGIMFVAAYMAWRGAKMRSAMLLDTSPPAINTPGTVSGYTAEAFSGRQPLGYLTGKGREEHKAEVPASAVSNFPY
jgi:hypothetical protein